MHQILENEKWIEGFEGIYSVTGSGEIFSFVGGVKKELTGGVGFSKTLGRSTYRVVYLSKNKKGKTYSVHSLVAKHFVDKPDAQDKLVINHKDGNKQNNSADNLEWITNRENAIHASEVLGTLGLDEVEIKRRTICVLEGCDDRYQFTKYKKFVDKTLLMESDVPISILDCVFPSNIFGMRQYWNYLLELFSDRESGSTLLELSNKYGKDIAFLSRVRSKKLYKKQWSIYETFKKS